ncbi:MAG: DUF1566 domain-containing protein [Paludibacteraceae bacterium]|nr:DUF1566 domain-containing protein [Paludibacteraceae bacterium]
MKKYLSLFACILISFALFLTGCQKENDIVRYFGQVVYKGTTNPLADLDVKLTDGSNISVSTKTDVGGCFSFRVNVMNIDGAYYVLVGNDKVGQKKVQLPGYGRPEFDMGIIELQGPSVPVVQMDTILSVGVTSATFQGTVESDGMREVTERGFCYAKTDYPTIENQHITSGKGLGTFIASALDLEINTTYYVCAYATNEMGTAYSKSIKFTTSDGKPSVETTDPGENITETSIGAGGNVVDDFGYPVTARGVVYSTLPYPALENASVVESGSGKGYFSANIIDVTPASNTYYIRAYATNSNGTSYGEQIAIAPERSQYLTLPVVEYGGYRYHVYKDMGAMDWNSAKQLCDDLTFAGYDDWFLPDQYELRAIGEAEIRGWVTTMYVSYSHYEERYWSSSWDEHWNDYYIYISSDTEGTDVLGKWGGTQYASSKNVFRVRPVRKDKMQ